MLRAETLEPDAGLVTDIMAAVEAAGERGRLLATRSARVPFVAGGIGAATAGALGAVVLVHRHRVRRPAESG